MEIKFQSERSIASNQLERLYADVGWTAYTQDLAALEKAVEQSFDVLTAWHEDVLVGLIRIISDGVSIMYIQDILVLNDYQNQGIATQLMEKILMKYDHIRQKVLLTEEAADVRHFYEKFGFESCDQGGCVSFAKFN